MFEFTEDDPQQPQAAFAVAEFVGGPNDGKPQPIQPMPQVYAVVTIRDAGSNRVRVHDGFPFPEGTTPEEIIDGARAKLGMYDFSQPLLAMAAVSVEIIVHLYRACFYSGDDVWHLEYEGEWRDFASVYGLTPA